MQCDREVGVCLLDNVPVRRKANVTPFLVSGIAGPEPETIGEAYEDGSGNRYLPLFRQPVLIYAADAAGMRRAYERALDRGSELPICTREHFATGHDAPNRAAVAEVTAHRAASAVVRV